MAILTCLVFRFSLEVEETVWKPTEDMESWNEKICRWVRQIRDLSSLFFGVKRFSAQMAGNTELYGSEPSTMGIVWPVCLEAEWVKSSSAQLDLVPYPDYCGILFIFHPYMFSPNPICMFILPRVTCYSLRQMTINGTHLAVESWAMVNLLSNN